MRDEHRIDKAIEAGKENQRAKDLVENWCAHARVVKFGGTGLIEAQTGLPIGHHSIACDYASASGMATWLIAEAALDFHDRNCAGCTHRSPVRLPNLTDLLRTRDELRERRKIEEQRYAKDAAAALAARREARQFLRLQLDALGGSLIDHLETLDQERSDEAKEALLNTARLAPEVFTKQFVEHCFSLLESREIWFDETGLQLLQILGVDAARLTHCALLCLGRHSSVNTAAVIVEENPGNLEVSLIEKALPALVYLALPPDTQFMNERPDLLPGPLCAVYRAHPKPVERAIEEYFKGERNNTLQIACRAVIVLAKSNPMIAASFARSIAAQLARSDRLEDDDAYPSNIDSVVHDLRRALAQAIHQAPDDTDSLILSFIEGARSHGQAQLYSAHREVLRVNWRNHEAIPITQAHVVAIKRLIWAATLSRDDEVIKELQNAFGSFPDELATLARQEIEGLLGAALFLDDHLNSKDTENKIVDPSPLAGLEKLNQRNRIYYLQTNLIQWAAEAAAGDPKTSEKYMALLAGVPAEREGVRAVLLENASQLVGTPDGLAIVLPTLYSAMVGTSNLMRAAAATLIKDMASQRKDDLPELILETLVMQLHDPYVIVHRAAVKALDDIKLPESLASKAMLALWTLIAVYADDRKADDFLVRCIHIFSNRHATGEQLKGEVGKFLISLLHKMQVHVVSREVVFLSRKLKSNDAFASLLLHLANSPEASEYDEERIFDAMSKLTPSVVRLNKAGFEEAAKAASGRRHLTFIEVLTRAGAWEEAARVAENAYAIIPDTNWDRPRRLSANLDRIAANFECAVAASNSQSLHSLAAEWRDTCKLIEQDREKNEERRNPLAGLLSSN